ncbi:MAG: sulfite exporter TauE/SafE family protein [Actinomycetota bacterium]|nr:sulfite exporter TauE/SafE family protein [Actinomycetota bacterium]
MGAAVVVLVPAGAASAHPLGNFTINTYSGLRIGDQAVSVDYLVDMAEIPTLQRRTDMEQPGYAARECGRLLAQIDARVDGTPLALGVASSAITFPPGQAGLRTSRLACEFRAPAVGLSGEHRVSFASRNFTDRAGWREITAVGDRTTLLASDVPSRSISQRLARYPEDLLSSPVDKREASVLVRAGGPPAAAGSAEGGGAAARLSPLPRGAERATKSFTSYVTRQNLTVGFALLTMGASLVLGAIHALAPGHGKTVMAAYLVGQRGSFRQAMAVAVTVTATHTAGVLALGIAISASAVVAPERLYPWLGAASGILLALIGGGLLLRAIRLRRRMHVHHHDDGHHHGEENGHVHSHRGRRHSHGPVGGDQLVTWRGLLAMGFVGGLLPSPSAVVVLLGAIALGRAWFGVLLVIVYGLGMAATLTGAGLLLLRARRALDRRATVLRPNGLLQTATRLVPIATAAFIVVVGLYLTVQGAAQI